MHEKLWVECSVHFLMQKKILTHEQDDCDLSEVNFLLDK